AMRATPRTPSAACATTVRNTRGAMRTAPSCSGGRLSSRLSSRAALATPACREAAVSSAVPLGHVCILWASPFRLARTSPDSLPAQALVELVGDRGEVRCGAKCERGGAFGNALYKACEHLPGADFDEGGNTLTDKILDRPCPLH